MGRLLSKLPTDVHLGKFLLVAAVFGCLDPALTIAAALSSKSPFVTPFGLEQEADKARSSFQSGMVLGFAILVVIVILTSRIR
jgi:ATP-dependent RNA helicase DHX29